MLLAYSFRPSSNRPIGFEAICLEAKALEKAGFDLILLDDSQRDRQASLISNELPFEPTTLAAALATKTDEIGFLVTGSTVEHEPYNLARRYASLDNSSNGRAGWNVVASSQDPNRDSEFVEVVKSLWDSWEDDAFVYDKAAGRFFQPEKMHVLNHRGDNFSVRGPLNVNRSPQGRPVISFVLSAQTGEMAARYADVVFIRENSFNEATAATSRFRSRLETHGRPRSEVKVIVALEGGSNSVGFKAVSSSDAFSVQPVRGPSAGEPAFPPLEAADIVRNQIEQLDVDGIELQLPVDAKIDAWHLEFASLLRNGNGTAFGRKRTLRERLDLTRPAFATANQGQVQ